MSIKRDSFSEELKADLHHYQQIRTQCLKDLKRAERENNIAWKRARHSALKAIDDAINRTEAIIEGRKSRPGFYQTKDGSPGNRFKKYPPGWK